ncbi:MAG TPA: two-component sensor histidine kinase, partial [Clostridiales bacterium]|nr:two-component sensor histidine kinase [Clostridiales bacterium]
TDAGHEIKTPLAIINADADVLIAENGEDNEWVNDIKKQTARLSELTNDLIFLSKMEEGGEPSVSSKIDLSDVLSDRVSSFKAVALAGGKTITTNIDKDVFINGDPDRVSELINILLDNAVKYSPEGKEIFAGCSLRGKTAVLEVENESLSRLTDKDLDSLFDRFYRADRSRNSQSGGFGIGLSVAHAIVRSMDGKILVQRKDNGRILFSVSVPAVV